ncbi:alanine racemase [Ornithinimicrobium sp. Arc0846-15]|nr:alanine racemase [Ornithinimicrobium laminariae]
MGATEEPPDTPFLAVELDVLQRNIDRIARSAAERGLVLRPHGKTHKVAQIAAMQMTAGAVGLTLATIGEAEVFADAGVDDIFLAYPLWPTPRRVARIRELAGRVQLSMGIDSVESATRWGQALQGVNLHAVVEVDSGHHRSGIWPDQAGVVADAAQAAGLPVAGVFTFPGHGYTQDRAETARQEAAALKTASVALRASGHEVWVISGGSTPTFASADSNALTEIRPGVYVFNDAQQVELGTVSFADVALTAHATVVSKRGNTVIVDAGSKVLGADRQPWVSGGGRLPEHPQARITALSEHHATVQFPEGMASPGLGVVVRVAPNHVCVTVNLADELVIVRREEDVWIVLDRWVVAARGRNG